MNRFLMGLLTLLCAGCVGVGTPGKGANAGKGEPGCGGFATDTASEDPTFTAAITDVDVEEAVSLLCLGTGLTYRVLPAAVLIERRTAPGAGLSTRFYAVTPVFGDVLAAKPDVKAYFASMGTQFPAGTAIQYVPEVHRLVVTHYAEGFELVECILSQLDLWPPLLASDSRPPDSLPRACPIGLEPIYKKLRTIVIPKLTFNQTPVWDAVCSINAQVKQLDPEGKGISIFLCLPPSGLSQW